MCLNVTFTTYKDHTKSWKPSALKLKENEWIVFSTVSHPFIFSHVHPIATTEFLQKLLQALCLQTILLKLVGLHAFSWIWSSKEVKTCINRRHIAPGNINGIKRVHFSLWDGMCLSPSCGAGCALTVPCTSVPPRLAINQYPGMDLHPHGGIVKRLWLRLRSCVGLTQHSPFYKNHFGNKMNSQHLC